MNGVEIIEGGLHVDARGSVTFFNQFVFRGVERFYIIRPKRPGAVRGWVGHRYERKWFAAVEGRAAVAVVRPYKWESPDPNSPVAKFVLSAEEPRLLAVPEGHATAIIGISPASALMVFSSTGIDEAAFDTYRYPNEFWSIPQDSRE